MDGALGCTATILSARSPATVPLKDFMIRGGINLAPQASSLESSCAKKHLWPVQEVTAKKAAWGGNSLTSDSVISVSRSFASAGFSVQMPAQQVEEAGGPGRRTPEARLSARCLCLGKWKERRKSRQCHRCRWLQFYNFRHAAGYHHGTQPKPFLSWQNGARHSSSFPALQLASMQLLGGHQALALPSSQTAISSS